MPSRPIGLVLGSEVPPEQVTPLVTQAEDGGFGEVWMAEDCFYSGGVSGSAVALGATRSIPVGIGVVSAVTRHPAVLAMEIATLARTFPGRLWPAVGLGVPGWLQQMGLNPASPLKAVRECMTLLRRLLDGEQTRSDGIFSCEDIQLAYPPHDPVPLRMGVAGPKMLQLSGEVSDGTLLSVMASPQYVAWAREQIALGAKRAESGPRPHEITTFALCAVDEDSAAAKAAARAAVGFYLAAGGPNALTEAYGINDELRAMLETTGPSELHRDIPDEWVEDLAVAGDPDECAAKIERLIAAGSDQVALFPTPPERASRTVELLAREVIPKLRASDRPQS